MAYFSQETGLDWNDWSAAERAVWVAFLKLAATQNSGSGAVRCSLHDLSELIALADFDEKAPSLKRVEHTIASLLGRIGRSTQRPILYKFDKNWYFLRGFWGQNHNINNPNHKAQLEKTLGGLPDTIADAIRDAYLDTIADTIPDQQTQTQTQEQTQEQKKIKEGAGAMPGADAPPAAAQPKTGKQPKPLAYAPEHLATAESVLAAVAAHEASCRVKRTSDRTPQSIAAGIARAFPGTERCAEALSAFVWGLSDRIHEAQCLDLARYTTPAAWQRLLADYPQMPRLPTAEEALAAQRGYDFDINEVTR